MQSHMSCIWQCVNCILNWTGKTSQRKLFSAVVYDVYNFSSPYHTLRDSHVNKLHQILITGIFCLLRIFDGVHQFLRWQSGMEALRLLLAENRSYYNFSYLGQKIPREKQFWEFWSHTCCLELWLLALFDYVVVHDITMKTTTLPSTLSLALCECNKCEEKDSWKIPY